MNYKPIIVVAGEPNSIFLEIFFKSLKKKKIKSPIILIASRFIVEAQMKKLSYKFNINSLNINNIKINNLNNKNINLINVNYKSKKIFEKITARSKKYIERSFLIALQIIKKNISDKLINGPISKKYFLKKKYFGITEYLADKTNQKKFAMLIFNKKLSVCPITTHVPIKFISKKINKEIIKNKIILINNFFKNFIGIKPTIAVTGLNPHCESTEKINKDISIIKPTVKFLKNKGLKISGPYAADTIFLKNNRKNYDVIVGMYHDQVLTPIKTLFEYDAINITLGLPFIRISPDHGPNENMMGKNLSNPLSLIRALEFLDI